MKRIWAGVVLLALTAIAFADDAPKLPTADEVLAKMKTKWADMKSFEIEAKETLQKEDGRPRLKRHSMRAWRGWRRTARRRKEFHPSQPRREERGRGEGRLEYDYVNDGTYVWNAEVYGTQGKTQVMKGLAGLEKNRCGANSAPASWSIYSDG